MDVLVRCRVRVAIAITISMPSEPSHSASCIHSRRRLTATSSVPSIEIPRLDPLSSSIEGRVTQYCSLSVCHYAARLKIAALLTFDS